MSRKILTIKTKREPEAVSAQIKDLERIAAKRRGRPGYSANVADIEKLISECKMELANG